MMAHNVEKKNSGIISSIANGAIKMKRNQNIQYLLAGIVGLITCIVYLRALQNAFVGVWDDNAYVVENPHIRSFDPAFFRWAFTTTLMGNWNPLTWLSHAIDFALWSLNPAGHHLTSILLHAVNASLVVLLVIKLLDIAREEKKQKMPITFLNDRIVLVAAGVTGLLFGLHPLHVESVAWVAERKDLLCALFFLLSVMSYTNYALTQQSINRRLIKTDNQHEAADGAPQATHSANIQVLEGNTNNKKQYVMALGLFILALMSKPMAVTLPVVLLILDWYPLGRIGSLKTFGTASIEKIPFFVISLVSSIVTILAQQAAGALSSIDKIPLSTRIPVAVKSLIAYLVKMLLPLHLIPFYPFPRNVSLLSFETLSLIFLASVLTVASVYIAKKQKLWLTAWGYYIITILPVLGIVQVGSQAMADRYTYLPSLGPFLITGLCVATLGVKARIHLRQRVLLTITCSVGALLIFFILTQATLRQIDIWKNGLALWDYAIASGVESATAYNNRGLSLEEMGQRDKAIADFEKALALDPRNYFAYNNRGIMYGKDGQYQRSLEYFLKAISINPNHADSYCNLGLSYFNMHAYDKALENYTRAIELKKDFDMAYLDRGNLYFVIGKRDLAMNDYRKACELGNGKACEILTMAIGE